MALSAGDRLGPYEILAALGAGGMGEVYRARDPRVGRDVAIKVSKDQFSERFEREARAVAALNHPNICHLYDVGPNYLVMELVEGESPKGPLPLEEGLRLGRQIAAALEAAHEKGIVHRDLKPGNIKITPDGTVKVLDFGLAKLPPMASSSAGENSPTLTMGATVAGMILGTAAYMSPEQARGKVADKRADIWAFGVVLYELITGHKLFQGEDVTEILASVVKEQPDLSQVPDTVRPLLERCLDKDPRKRLRDIGDMELLLAKPVPPPSREPARTRPVAWIVAGAATVGLAVVSFLYFRESPPEPRPIRFEIRPPEKASFDFFELSPDGRSIAFTGGGLLWLRALDSLEARSFPGSDGAGFPFWSPDSQNIAFFAGGKLKRVAAAGGPPLTICDAPALAGGTWGSKGIILFSTIASINQVPESGGSPTPLVKQDGLVHVMPQFLPDDQHFLETTLGKADESGVFLRSLGGKPPVRLLPDQVPTTYAPAVSGSAGHLMFVRSGTLMAQPFDPRGFRLTGPAFPVVEHIASIFTLGLYSASRDGSLIYVAGQGNEGANAQLVWKDRTGKTIGAFGPPGNYLQFRLAPDEKRLVYMEPSGNDIWALDSVRGIPSRLTFDPAADNLPILSYDGQQVLWPSNRRGSFDLYVKSANGTGEDRLLVKMGTSTGWGTDWSRDGRFILFQRPGEKTGQDLWVAPQSTAGGSAPEPYPYLNTQFDEAEGRFSPDGKWVAYLSNETGLYEVYVQSFPLSGAKFQITNGGAGQVEWSKDGTELFYVGSTGMLVSVPVKLPRTASESFQPGAPHELFRVGTGGAPPVRAFGVSRDGRRFLVSGDSGAGKSTPMTVVLNWQSGLRQ